MVSVDEIVCIFPGIAEKRKEPGIAVFAGVKV
jgi:hypothetical protein